jgi:hypothetical protein
MAATGSESAAESDSAAKLDSGLTGPFLFDLFSFGRNVDGARAVAYIGNRARALELIADLARPRSYGPATMSAAWRSDGDLEAIAELRAAGIERVDTRPWAPPDAKPGTRPKWPDPGGVRRYYESLHDEHYYRAHSLAVADVTLAHARELVQFNETIRFGADRIDESFIDLTQLASRKDRTVFIEPRVLELNVLTLLHDATMPDGTLRNRARGSGARGSGDREIGALGQKYGRKYGREVADTVTDIRMECAPRLLLVFDNLGDAELKLAIQHVVQKWDRAGDDRDVVGITYLFLCDDVASLERQGPAIRAKIDIFCFPAELFAFGNAGSDSASGTDDGESDDGETDGVPLGTDMLCRLYTKKAGPDMYAGLRREYIARGGDARVIHVSRERRSTHPSSVFRSKPVTWEMLRMY